jgi:hypothetical protein
MSRHVPILNLQSITAPSRHANLHPVTSKWVPEQIQTIDVTIQVWDRQTFTVTSKHVRGICQQTFTVHAGMGKATSIVPGVICVTAPLRPE